VGKEVEAVTEAEWLACSDPEAMLGCGRGKISERQLRLFAVSCCRMVWHLLHKRARKAITITEEFVDGRKTAQAWEEARRGLWHNTYYLVTPRNLSGTAREAAKSAARAVNAALAPEGIPTTCCREVIEAQLLETEGQHHSLARAGLAQLLRDILGNPFRPATAEPSWLAWNGGTVMQLTEGIYDDRAFDRLPVLADALEESGCADRTILEHCRGSGPHVRGCWAIDLLLAKAQSG
jgi:hypothetical protein